ncbi:hypothetical protein LLE49_24580 [Alicyclobacillus tolerans]|uniref:hypothetical protein n=1 Tax=Alicyclobacillus tolerans TaxID=90970 RepID=UPI001F1EFB6B|nr:hypothetical protein [Alicyclobacillus tolerans]MCF8567903.1 hypothetical protein [Alicyclobacillus tolerans]
MSIFSFKTQSGSGKRSGKKKEPITWKEAIGTYKKDRGWENVKHSRDPLTPKQTLFLVSFDVQSSVRRDTSRVTISRHVHF